MLRHQPRFRLLAIFQTLAGLALLPLVLLDGSRGTELPVLLVVIGWFALAAVNLIGGTRLPPSAYAGSTYISTGLVLLHAAVTPLPSMQVLDGLELLVLMLVATFALPESRVRVLLVVSCGLYLGALIVNPLPLGVWIGPVVVGMIVVTTFVVLGLMDEVMRVNEHDPLTGALNRAGLRTQAQVVQALTVRTGLPTTVVFIDLDGFKPYNDRHGHVAGDELLADLVRGFQHHLRKSDLTARIGGDEFVLVLPGIAPPQADEVVQRLAQRAPIGFTYGTWQWEPGEEFLTAVDEADRRMYQRKLLRRRPRVPRPAQ